MTEVVLNKWGNSLGLRLPAGIAKKIKAYVGERFSVEAASDGVVVFKPIEGERASWKNRLNAIADEGKDDFSDFEGLNSFDQEEWDW